MINIIAMMLRSNLIPSAPQKGQSKSEKVTQSRSKTKLKYGQTLTGPLALDSLAGNALSSVETNVRRLFERFHSNSTEPLMKRLIIALALFMPTSAMAGQITNEAMVKAQAICRAGRKLEL